MRGVVLAVCLIAGGCGATSFDLSDRTDRQNLLERIERGATTKDQVRSLFGNTDKIDLLDDGYEQWTYQSSTPLISGRYIPGVGFAPETEKQTFVMIVFDKSGIVRHYSSSTQIR